MFNVTLGLEKGGELIAGVVYDPTRDEMFSAERGGGAYLNGERIQVSTRPRWKTPGRDRLSEPQAPSERQRPFLLSARHADAWRSTRRRSRDRLCYVACGRLDAFWEFGLNPWDMAAGISWWRRRAARRRTCTANRTFGLPTSADQWLFARGDVELFAEIFRGEYRYPMVEMALPSSVVALLSSA